jgi:hypothetical protein
MGRLQHYRPLGRNLCFAVRARCTHGISSERAIGRVSHFILTAVRSVFAVPGSRWAKTMNRLPNEATAPDTASPVCLHSLVQGRGTGEFFR